MNADFLQSYRFLVDGEFIGYISYLEVLTKEQMDNERKRVARENGMFKWENVKMEWLGSGNAVHH